MNIDFQTKKISNVNGLKVIDVLNMVRKVDKKNWEQYVFTDGLIVLEQNPNKEGWKNNPFDR